MYEEDKINTLIHPNECRLQLFIICKFLKTKCTSNLNVFFLTGFSPYMHKTVLSSKFHNKPTVSCLSLLIINWSAIYIKSRFYDLFLLCLKISPAVATCRKKTMYSECTIGNTCATLLVLIKQ